ncbi:hypothetical protein [Gallibacterium anatis]|uniref:Uncharacterized protein n=1 Tax=Gallibacterium anatis TaxID=750 RepID=A0A1A7NZU8_9PAST|nr:hypothetical protein [Gallibacterium anatis]KGQ59346.1 hypothetical protein IE01_00055 [Gallibacterium anatis DSM 16844 = F 149]OBW94606.1 hypothetical protein QV02_06840 [Gallibacterium anatis]OBW95115.1 hypothetical protein QV03_11715 [Gallibacterium anatis]STO37422.1 Uncharacterised protein [Gallibacterium anatis]
MTKQKLLQGGKFLLMIAALLLLSLLLLALGMHAFPGTQIKAFFEHYQAVFLVWRICLYGVVLFLMLKIASKSEFWKQRTKRPMVLFVVFIAVSELSVLISHWR